jgi:bacterioferritin
MKGNAEVIKALNAVLTNELTAINQYFLHARMIENWGMAHLGKVIYKESIEEMEHADKLIKRIFFLEGLPNLQDLHKLKIGENITECLECDYQLEIGARQSDIDAITLCESVKDYASRDIIQEILNDTEHHIDFLETQLGLIKLMGVQNYIQNAMKEIEA